VSEFSGLSQWDDSMRLALDQARMASMHGDVPVGAVIIDQAGSVLAAAANEREIRHDPTAHAELLALRAASRRLRSWRLTGLTLVVTLEPCTMCAGALVLARIARLVFGAFDEKAGAVSSLFDVVRDPRLNHRVEVRGGVLEVECGALLKDFFASRKTC
jgi:tRNA(adenine34) deaminase